MQIDSRVIRHQFDTPAVSTDRAWRVPCLLFAMSSFVLLASGQALGQEAAPLDGTHAEVPAVEQMQRPQKSGKVCQSEEVIGSRMKKRVCLTPEQWEARERQAKELKREMDVKPTPKDGQGG